jgi:signal transduction histidine kinase
VPSPENDLYTDLDITSVLVVPLRVRDSIIGVLEVVNKANGIFTSNDQSLVETLAASAAIAIDNTQLFETLRRQTVDLQTRNEDLKAFSQTVAHDLKNPLATMVGFSQILTTERLPEDKKTQFLAIIEHNARKMISIVDELLLLAMLHNVDPELEPVNMAHVVDEIQQRLAYMIDEYKAEIIVPERWPLIISYGPWIEEVLVNYVSNAMKYGGRPPRIELGATPLPDSKMMQLWVKDNGAGLSPEEKDRLFTPFTRFNQVQVEGHGLGLSIVHRIVKKLGGEVGVESTRGEGSVFSFTLPAPDSVL